MAAYILGVFREGKKVNGYRIFSFVNGGAGITLRDVKDAELKQLMHARPNATLVNARLGSNDEIEFTQGAMSAYPVLDSNGALMSTAGLTVVYAIIDNNDVIIGYGVVDTYGLLANITKKGLIGLSTKYRTTNWEVYTTKSGESDIRAKSGSFIRVVKSQAANLTPVNSKMDSKEELEAKQKQNKVAAEKIKAEQEERENQMKAMQHENDLDAKAAVEVMLKNTDDLIEIAEKSSHISSEIISLSSTNILPCLKVYDLKDCFEGEFNKDAQIKLTQIKANLVNVAPYYASMMDAIRKVPCTAVETMGVTEDTLYYNPKFLATLSKGEATFIYIHEMLHIAMQHSVRHGKRDNVLWNIACDLFINELICKDFGVQFGGSAAQVSRQSALDNRVYSGVIQTPNTGIFLATIGESLDFARDTVESIYTRLVKENPDMKNQTGQQGQQGQSGQQGQQGQQSGGQGQQSSGQQSGQQTGQQTGSQSGQQSDGQGGQQNGQQGNQQGGQGQNSLGDSDDFGSIGNDASGDKSSSELQSDAAETNNSEYNQKSVEVEVNFNGKKIKAKISLDVMSNRDSVSRDNPKTSMNESKNALKRIQVKREMDIQQGKDMSMSSGSTMVEREIKFAMTVSYNWEQILRNLANAKPKKKYTLASPNTDYSNMGMTLATRQKIGRNTKVEGLKICVDVSGSIGEKELHKVFSKIKQILDIYEVSAEMIYWDTEITNVGDFEDMKGMLKVKPKGCGGTDVRCVFDYLLGRTKFNGKKEKTPLRDISGLLIFTDGYIGTGYDEYARYFGRTTYWIIDDGSPAFEPLFGKVAKTKLN